MPRIAFRPLVLIAVLALMAVIVGAQAPVPQPEDQETAREVVDLLERNHMARPAINDEIAVKWCDNFIKDLDPDKYYFLEGATSTSSRRKPRPSTTRSATETSTSPGKSSIGSCQRSDERFKTSMELAQAKTRLHGRRIYQRRSRQNRLSGRQGRGRRASAQEGQARPTYHQGGRGP